MSDKHTDAELIYSHLRVLDDLFDNNPPQVWQSLGDIPTSMDDIMISGEPCGFLKNVYSREAIAHLNELAGQGEAERSAMWQMMNAACFHLANMSSLEAQTPPGDTSPENVARIEQLATMNMQWSYLATLITRSQEQNVALSRVAVRLPDILDESFVPNAYDKDRPLLGRYEHDQQVLGIPELDMLMFFQGLDGQLGNDASDVFTDLDQEMTYGRITPNVVLGRIRSMTYNELADRFDKGKKNAARYGEAWIADITLPRSDDYIDINAEYARLREAFPENERIMTSEVATASPVAFAMIYEAEEARRGYLDYNMNFTGEAKRKERLERAKDGSTIHTADAAALEDPEERKSEHEEPPQPSDEQSQDDTSPRSIQNRLGQWLRRGRGGREE